MSSGNRIIPLYIHSPAEHGDWTPGAASNWWLHYSLAALQAALSKRGSRLIFQRGNSSQILQHMIQQHQCAALYCNNLYEPALLKRDNKLFGELGRQGVDIHRFDGSILFAPGTVMNKIGNPYRVFTPFYRYCTQEGLPEHTLPQPRKLPAVPTSVQSDSLASLELLPAVAWDEGIQHTWQPGESRAQRRLKQAVENIMLDYPVNRDRPAVKGTSRLSASLHFGELSPRQVIQQIQQYMACNRTSGIVKGGEALQRQIVWREFANHLLYHFPHTTNKAMDVRFRHFPWNRRGGSNLHAWQHGLTGVPIIDAGMRELWHTGWMHNRVRMVVASMLIKNMGIHWLQGARWFWDTLVDADLACNTLNWQWVAGCGADAAPYFRVFNPYRQSEKFDPQALYIKRWVTELKNLPAKTCHRPMLQEPDLLTGSNYPLPIVDIDKSRQRSLAVYREHMQGL
jgi:deoxyribodipyrimidine photo-lyase